MSNTDFFEERTEQSRVKAAIVSKYFRAWAKVMIPVVKKGRGPQKIAYIDLFAGPGRYKDGSVSTPLLVLQEAIEDADLREMLLSLFNDENPDISRTLEKEIKALPEINRLKHQPTVYNKTIDEEIVQLFEHARLVPTLFFIDPFGYKGLSLRLVKAVLKDFGCDCIFFFNYTRISMGLSNPAVVKHMNSLFGKERADHLRSKIDNLDSNDRELSIVEELGQAMKEIGGKYVLPFCFKNENGTRTSHHLFFVSKHFRGYDIMKEIMAKESSASEQGVPSFGYCPATKKQLMLFEFARPLDDLHDMLLEEFVGRTLTMVEIYEKHNVGRPFIKANYKEVLKKLEGEGLISADPPAVAKDKGKARKKGTFADTVRVTFRPQRN